MAVDNPTDRQSAIPPAVQREIDLLRARVDFPLADVDVLNLLQGTPEQIRGAAQKLHESALKANAVPPAPPPPAAAPPPAVTDNAPPAGGGPVPVPGSGQVQPPEQVADAHYNDLLYKAEHKTASEQEREELFFLALRNGWNDQARKMASRPGRS